MYHHGIVMVRYHTHAIIKKFARAARVLAGGICPPPTAERGQNECHVFSFTIVRSSPCFLTCVCAVEAVCSTSRLRGGARAVCGRAIRARRGAARLRRGRQPCGTCSAARAVAARRVRA